MKSMYPTVSRSFPPPPSAARDVTTIVRDTPVLTCLDADHYGDWRDDLKNNGWCVVKNVLTKEKADDYISQMHDWLEGFNLGYNRNDRSTIRTENLPIIHQKGLIPAYGATHETFTWGIRQEPAVLETFTKLFGTEDLIVSFDAININFANRKDVPPVLPWPHQDQDPDRPGLRCIQAYVNLAESGDDDGGLIVLNKGHEVSKPYHDAARGVEVRQFQHTNEVYAYTQEGVDQMRDMGYGEWIKVNAGPGDIVMWDSRVPHYNVNPTGERDRFAAYTCYYPAALCTQEELERKKDLFTRMKGHSHWPMALQPYVEAWLAPKRDGKPDPLNTWRPRNPPQLGERGMKLTGIPYIQASA